MDVGQILTLNAHKYPNRTAILFEDKRLTYLEFNDRVNQLAHSLLRMGLKKGEKVAALLFNSNHFVEAYFATAKVAGVFTPVNFRLAAEEVHYILNHSDTHFFIFGEEFSDLVKGIQSRLERVEIFISAGEKKIKRALDYETLLKIKKRGTRYKSFRER
jgi:fatty-acyl-CoA synthase